MHAFTSLVFPYSGLSCSLSCPGFWPSQEGALCFHPLQRAPGAFMRKPCIKDLTGFLCKPRNPSLFLSLFYFLIIDSRPPGFSPLKDPNIILDTFYTRVNSKMIKYLNLCFCSKPIVKLQSNRPIVLCDTRNVSPLQEGMSRSQLVLRKTSL